jgi:hypothetical protein
LKPAARQASRPGPPDTGRTRAGESGSLEITPRGQHSNPNGTGAARRLLNRPCSEEKSWSPIGVFYQEPPRLPGGEFQVWRWIAFALSPRPADQTLPATAFDTLPIPGVDVGARWILAVRLDEIVSKSSRWRPSRADPA